MVPVKLKINQSLQPANYKGFLGHSKYRYQSFVFPRRITISSLRECEDNKEASDLHKASCILSHLKPRSYNTPRTQRPSTCISLGSVEISSWVDDDMSQVGMSKMK